MSEEQTTPWSSSQGGAIESGTQLTTPPNVEQTAWSLATACAFSSGLPLRIPSWTEDFDHLSVLENNDVLVSFGVAQTNRAFLTDGLGFLNRVRKEMRLMPAVAFVG
jgi:hypothetical protein